MVLLHFRTPNIMLGIKSSLKCQHFARWVITLTVKSLVKPRGPIIEKCLSPMCYLLRMLKHILNNMSFAKVLDQTLKSSTGHLTPLWV